MNKTDSEALSPEQEIISETDSRPRLFIVKDADPDTEIAPDMNCRPRLTKLICGIRDRIFRRKNRNNIGLVLASADTNQNTVGVDPKLLSEARNYFESHFLLSPEDVPFSVLKIMATIPNHGDGIMRFKNKKFIFDEDVTKNSVDYVDLLMAKGSTGNIPCEAFNLFFLIEGNEEAVKLLNKAIDNYLRDRVKIERQYLDPKDYLLHDKKKRKFVIQRVLNEIRKRYGEEINLKDIFDRIRILDEVLDDADKKFNKVEYSKRVSNRKNAVKYIDTNFNAQNWSENPLALDDKKMSQFFSEKNKETDPCSFLTTYFDSALKGLSVSNLDKIIKRFVKKEYKDLIRYSKENILQALEPTKSRIRFTRRIDDHSPISANLFFTKNGQTAAELFIDHFIHEGDRILMGKQEYVPIKKYLRGKKAEVIDELPVYTGDDEAFVSQVEDLVVDRGINFIMVSDISRLGGIQAPLRLFWKIRDRHPDLKLIVDACQTIGRKVVDYNDDEVNPDVIIASCQKGFETCAETSGFLVVSDSMLLMLKPTDQLDVRLQRFIEKAKEVEKGSEQSNLPVDARIACAPDNELEMYLSDSEITKSIPKEILEKICSSVKKRESALKDLSSKFAQLVQRINKKHGGRIKILNPDQAAIYKPGEKIDEKNLSGIFECKIEGVTLDQAMKVAREYGVTIGDPREDELKDKMEELKKQDKTPDEKKKLQEEIDAIMANHEGGISEFDTFRIAFHPYVGNEAIKILGYVLHECCRRYPMHN